MAGKDRTVRTVSRMVALPMAMGRLAIRACGIPTILPTISSPPCPAPPSSNASPARIAPIPRPWDRRRHAQPAARARARARVRCVASGPGSPRMGNARACCRSRPSSPACTIVALHDPALGGVRAPLTHHAGKCLVGSRGRCERCAPRVAGGRGATGGRGVVACASVADRRSLRHYAHERGHACLRALGRRVRAARRAARRDRPGALAGCGARAGRRRRNPRRTRGSRAGRLRRTDAAAGRLVPGARRPRDPCRDARGPARAGRLPAHGGRRCARGTRAHGGLGRRPAHGESTMRASASWCRTLARAVAAIVRALDAALMPDALLVAADRPRPYTVSLGGALADTPLVADRTARAAPGRRRDRFRRGQRAAALAARRLRTRARARPLRRRMASTLGPHDVARSSARRRAQCSRRRSRQLPRAALEALAGVEGARRHAAAPTLGVGGAADGGAARHRLSRRRYAGLGGVPDARALAGTDVRVRGARARAGRGGPGRRRAHGLRASPSSTVFQPEGGDPPVQVLGLLEAEGLEFDHLWITGLTSEGWPLAGACSSAAAARTAAREAHAGRAGGRRTAAGARNARSACALGPRGRGEPCRARRRPQPGAERDDRRVASRRARRAGSTRVARPRLGSDSKR